MRFAVLIAAVLTAGAASARCKTDGVFLFPAPGAVIPLNAKIILEGAGKEQSRVDALVGRTLLLRASDPAAPPVSVVVKAGWVSQRARTAVVLLPQSQLLPGREYSLLIDKLLPGYTVLNDDALDTMTWTSAQVADNTPPRFQARPTVPEGISNRDRTGVSAYLKLRAQIIEDSPAYFVVRLVLAAKPGSVKQVYPVPINGGEALIGSDACSGGFALEPSRTYKIELETYDSAGNKAAEKLPLFEAKSPLAPDKQ